MPALNTRFLVAHEVVGGKTSHDNLLSAYKESGKLPDTLEIMGVLIDDSKNANNWRVPESQFDGLISSLKDAPYLKDHEERVANIAGQVTDLWRDGKLIKYKAEIDDSDLIKKILRGRVKYSSVQIDSEEICCSRCLEDVETGKLKAEDLKAKGEYYSRKEGHLKHLHAGAHEVVLNPIGKEVSAVVFPAYKSAEFGPIGFKAALDIALFKSESELHSSIISGGDEGVIERNASDGQINEPSKVREMTEEKSDVKTLTAEDISNAVITAMRAYETERSVVAAKKKEEEDHASFMKTFETAIGKIGQLEKEYQAGQTKLEELLKKYEELGKKREEVKAKKKEQPPEETEETEETEEVEVEKRKPGEEDKEEGDVCPKHGVTHEDGAKHEEDEEGGKKKASKEITGKALTGKEGAELRTGLTAKMFPAWYKEIIGVARKHSRKEA